MSLFKKSILLKEKCQLKASTFIFMIWLSALGAHHSAHAFWSSEFAYASEVTFDQKHIAFYRAEVAVYPQGKFKTKTITTFSEEKPEALVQKIVQMNAEKSGKRTILYVKIQLELKSGRIFDMREIKFKTNKIKAIRKALADQLFVECDYIHYEGFFDTFLKTMGSVFYKEKLWHPLTTVTVKSQYVI